MNKRSYYWIKLHTAYLSDSKYLQLSCTAKYHYIALYLIACEGDSGGVLVQNEEVLSVKDMAFLLHENENDLQESINILIEKGLMIKEPDGAYTITRFMDEQGKASFGGEVDKKREQWRERQAKHRNKQINKGNLDSDVDKELDKELDKDSDKDIESHSDVTQKSRVTSRDGYFYTDSSSTPSTLFDEIKSKLENGLHINVDTVKWIDFIYYVCERQEKHNEPVDKFISWFLSNDYEIVYFPPEKMKTIYPQAFIPEKPFCVPLPPIKDEEECVPMPEHLWRKNKLN